MARKGGLEMVAFFDQYIKKDLSLSVANLHACSLACVHTHARTRARTSSLPYLRFPIHQEVADPHHPIHLARRTPSVVSIHLHQERFVPDYEVC